MTAESIYKNKRLVPGEYRAKWTSNYIRLLKPDGTYSRKIQMNVGVRGIGINCTALVDEAGKVIIKT